MSQSVRLLAASLVMVSAIAVPVTASASGSKEVISSSVVLGNASGVFAVGAKPKLITKFNAQRITRLAMTNFNRYVKANRKSKPHTLVFEDVFQPYDRMWMTRLTRATVSALPFQDGYNPVIVFAGSDKFINDTLRANGRSGQGADWCGRPTEYEAYCAGTGWAAMNYKYSIETGRSIFDPGKRAVAAHELFHVWHKTLDGSPVNNNVDPRLPNGFPLWFKEGTANFFGFAMAQNALKDSYMTGRVTQVNPYMQTSQRPLKEHIFWDTNPYGIGQAAAEYLVANVGMQKVMDVYVKVGQGKTFAAAFEESIGLSLEEFYTAFESVRANFTK